MKTRIINGTNKQYQITKVEISNREKYQVESVEFGTQKTKHEGYFSKLKDARLVIN